MNRHILRLAIPNIISNITVPLLGMVDMALMGHLCRPGLLQAIRLLFAVQVRKTSQANAREHRATNAPSILVGRRNAQTAAVSPTGRDHP